MAYYNVNKIENLYNDFSSIKRKFKNNYLNGYNSSYIKKGNNDVTNSINRALESHYNKISRIYDRIDKYWSEFLSDVKNTDLCIAGQVGAGSVKASSVSSLLSSLPNLQEYSADLGLRIKSISGGIGTAKAVGWSEDRTVGENLSSILESCAATISTAFVSLSEGLVKLCEDAVDLLAITGAAISSIGTGIVDLTNMVSAKISGDESLKTDYTKQIWDETRSFVSTDYTESMFDSFYENTSAGRWMKENAYAYDMVRSIGAEVGEVVGVTLLSIVTGGSAAVIYGGAKVAEHTEENWQDENTSTFGGLLKGGLQGTADGFFFALGAKGDATMKAAASKAVEQGSKQALKKGLILSGKTIFECGCSVVQDGSSIVLDALFSNDSIVDENGNTVSFNSFEDKLNYYYKQAGGLEGLVTSMLTAGALSFMSDASEVIKMKAPTSIDVNVSNNTVKNANYDVNIDSLKREYDELLKKSKEPWFVNAKEAMNNGYAWDLKDMDVADKTIKRMNELESIIKNNSQLNNTTNIQGMKFATNNSTNIDSLKREYDELLKKSKEPWFVNAKEALDNGYAWNLKDVDAADKTIKRMNALEYIIKNNSQLNNTSNIQGMKFATNNSTNVDSHVKNIDTNPYIKSKNQTNFESNLARKATKLADDYNYLLSLKEDGILEELKRQGVNFDARTGAKLTNIDATLEKYAKRIDDLQDLVFKDDVVMTSRQRNLYDAMNGSIQQLNKQFGVKYGSDIGIRQVTAYANGRVDLNYIPMNYRNIIKDYSYDELQECILLKHQIELCNEFSKNGKMTDKFTNAFAKYVDADKIVETENVNILLTGDAFKRFNSNEISMAFNNGSNSYINLMFPDDVVLANISHENIHQMSSNGVSGIMIDARHRGLNETFTEYLNKFSLKSDYPKMPYCGYQPMVDRLELLLSEGIFTNDDIMSAYFKNDISSIKNRVNELAGSDDYYDTFVKAFQNAHDKKQYGDLDKCCIDLINKRDSQRNLDFSEITLEIPKQ